LVAPEAEFKELGKSGARGAYYKNRLVAFVNSKTGESKVFPALEKLKPGTGVSERAKRVAAKVALESALFSKDGTEAVPLEPVTLIGAKRRRGEDISQPSEYLSYVRFQRRVDGLPVFGPGTRLVIGVAADGSVCALTHRWWKTIPDGEKMVARPRSEIARSIIEQLTPSANVSNVRVNKVEICYYDGGQSYLQPVYRFEATIEPRTSNQKSHAANSHVLGYLSIGTPREPLPTLGVQRLKPAGKPPTLAKGNVPQVSSRRGDPTVARYIIQNDIDEWWISSCEFLNDLQLGGSMSGISFTDSQYYWAETRFYLSEKESFVNSVHIALSENHGNWWKLWLDKNDDSANVFCNGIPPGGYGGGSGGSLAYWIIHSCEVVPSATDESTSFDCWWNVFNGLHAVVSYRTEMYIDDDVMGGFGFWIGLGASVVSAWLNEVVSNDSYQNNPMYHDDNRNIDEPMGRASAVVVCDHSDDTVNEVGPLDPATCLTEWWFDN